MTDKEVNKLITLKEVTETGFYCYIDDTERSYIYEVTNNTDKEWLKEDPEAKLLIEEWIYDYTDYDDRKVYGASGDLVATCFNTSTCLVYKIEDINYKVYGNSGQFLIEDKPTYKEQFQRKEQECKRLKAENFTLEETIKDFDKYGAIENLYAELQTAKQKLEQLKEDLRTGTHCIQCQKALENCRLQAVNEELKNQLQNPEVQVALSDVRTGEREWLLTESEELITDDEIPF